MARSGKVLKQLSTIFPCNSRYIQWTEQSFRNCLNEKQYKNNFSFSVLSGGVCTKALIFQAAVSYSANGVKTFLICHNELTKLPESIHGMPRPIPENMINLEIVYIPSYSLLINYLANCHEEVHSSASVFLIEDLLPFLVETQGTSLLYQRASVCTLLLELISHLTDRLNSCYILLGDSASEFDLVEFYLLHVDTVFYVKGNQKENLFELQSNHRKSLVSTHTDDIILHFKLFKGEFRLQQIFQC